MSSLIPPAEIAAIAADFAAYLPDPLVLETQVPGAPTDTGARGAPTYAPVAGGAIAARVAPPFTVSVVKPDGSTVFLTRLRFTTTLTAPVALEQSVQHDGARWTIIGCDVRRAWSVERVVDCEQDAVT